MVEEKVLDNGLHLYVSRLGHLHVAEYALFLRCGALYETKEDQGVSHFLEHLHYRRMGSIDHEDLNRIQARVGSELEGATYPEGMVYRFSCLPEDAPLVSDTMMQLLQPVRWNRGEIRAERQVVLRQIEAEEDDFDSRVEIYSRRTDRGAWPLMGVKSRIQGMPEKTLAAWRRRIFQPENAALCIAGPVSDEEIRETEARWGTLKGGSAPVPVRAEFPGFGKRTGADDAVWKGDGDLCRVQIMFDAPEAGMVEEMLLSALTGGSVDSLLFVRIREQLGYVAEIESYIEELSDRKLFCIRFDVSPDQLDAAMRETAEILVRIRGGIQEEQLLSGRQQLRMNQASIPDLPGAVNSVVGWGWIMHEKDVSSGLYLRELSEKVAAEDVARLADRLFRPQNLRVCVECPEKERTHGRKAASAFRTMLI